MDTSGICRILTSPLLVLGKEIRHDTPQELRIDKQLKRLSILLSYHGLANTKAIDSVRYRERYGPRLFGSRAYAESILAYQTINRSPTQSIAQPTKLRGAPGLYLIILRHTWARELAWSPPARLSAAGHLAGATGWSGSPELE